MVSTAFSETIIGRYESRVETFNLIEVVDGLSRPWAMTFLPSTGVDGSEPVLLITERTGGLRLYKNGTTVRITGIPRVASRGQGGLLDVALHPDFETNSSVYFTFSASYDGGYGTRVGRGIFNGRTIEDFEVIFSMTRATRTTHHFGSRMAFDRDGSLFFTIGDRGERYRAQDLQDHAGKILRIRDDGSIPDDNPFARSGDALPEIYSYGHRNAQGLVLDQVTGVHWAHEHGPQGGDEVNIVRPGINYGWPIVTYGREYSGEYIAPSVAPGLEQPIIFWVPSIAPSGLAIYHGGEFANWRGDLFAGALAGQQLRRLVVRDGLIVNQEILLKEEIGRIRDVREGPDGNVWILTDAARGRLFRLEPAN